MHISEQFREILAAFQWFQWTNYVISIIRKKSKIRYSLFVCLGGRQGVQMNLDNNPLQIVGVPFFRDFSSYPRIEYFYLQLLPSLVKG